LEARIAFELLKNFEIQGHLQGFFLEVYFAFLNIFSSGTKFLVALRQRLLEECEACSLDLETTDNIIIMELF
jgi:hypothetical protein